MLAFHFPQYLTTPDLRKKYDAGLLRQVLLVGMVIAGGMAVANLVHIFGTAVKSDRRFPGKCGVLGDDMPPGFVRQQLFPFTWKG